MKISKDARSLGCVDYGNNNLFEIMVDTNGVVGLSSHEDQIHPDGTCEAITVDEFIDEIKDREDFADVMKDLVHCLSKK